MASPGTWTLGKEEKTNAGKVTAAKEDGMTAQHTRSGRVWGGWGSRCSHLIVSVGLRKSAFVVVVVVCLFVFFP